MNQFVERNENPLSEGLRKLHQNNFGIIPLDWIDLQYSNIQNLITDPGANIKWLFEGDHQHPGGTLGPSGSADQFYFVFIRPLYLNYILLKTDLPESITYCRVTYIDGSDEVLAHSVFPYGDYDVFTSGAPTPVMAIQFRNTSGLIVSLYSIYMTTAVPASSTAPMSFMSSSNDFYTDDVITPIPAGPLGVSIVYGFRTQGILLLNNDTQPIEVSEDGGTTWKTLLPEMGIVRDSIAKIGLVLRDPAGAGGLRYQVWSW